MRHLLKIKCVDSRVNVQILSSKSVQFTLTTVQVPNLALTHTKRITVYLQHYSCLNYRVHSHAPSIWSHRGKKVVFPDFQPMRVSEEAVCIYLFRQNLLFTSMPLRSPVHVVPPLYRSRIHERTISLRFLRITTYIGRDEIGWVYLPTQLERTLQLCMWW